METMKKLRDQQEEKVTASLKLDGELELLSRK